MDARPNGDYLETVSLLRKLLFTESTTSEKMLRAEPLAALTTSSSAAFGGGTKPAAMYILCKIGLHKFGGGTFISMMTDRF